MLIEPERGQVSPNFLKYQDTADTGVEGGDNQVEARADRASLTALEVPVHIPSTSDIAEVCNHPDDHLSPNLPSKYHHDEYDGQFHFVSEEHAHQVHAEAGREAAVATTWEAEYTPLTPYVVTDTDDHDSDKENHDPNQEDYKDAKEVSGDRQMPKEWTHVAENAEEERVNEVWWRQKKALSGYITPGINGV